MNAVFRFLVIGFFCVLCGCQSVPTQTEQNNDPFESFNRVMTDFNFKVNRYLYQPTAKGYRKVTPDPLRTGLDNMTSNLGQPAVMVNALLQGDLKDAAHAFGRFFTNTTLGILGFFDVATALEIEAPKKDFGETLYVWGIKESGPYLVLPFLGPSNVRDTVGMGINFFIDPIEWSLSRPDRHMLVYRYAFWGITLIDKSTDLLTNIEKSSVDPYTSLKTMSEQNRNQFLSRKKVNAYEFDFDFDEDDNEE